MMSLLSVAATDASEALYGPSAADNYVGHPSHAHGAVVAATESWWHELAARNAKTDFDSPKFGQMNVHHVRAEFR